MMVYNAVRPVKNIHTKVLKSVIQIHFPAAAHLIQPTETWHFQSAVKTRQQYTEKDHEKNESD